MPLTSRESALKALNHFESVLQGKSKGEEFISKLDHYISDLSSLDRKHYTMLVQGVLRWKNRIDSIIGEFSHHKLSKIDRTSLNALRIGILELTYLSKIPPYAAVNEAVNLAGSKNQKAKAFVNGVLRQIIREKERIPLIPKVKDTMDCIENSLSYPSWFAELLLDNFGKEQALKGAMSLNEEEPLTLRVNRLKTTKKELLDSLRSKADLKESDWVETAICVPNGISNIVQLEEYKNGHFYIQNGSSQIVAKLLDSRKGDKILDVCSAPGGKSTHLAELTGDTARIYAMDLNEKKLGLIMENCARLGIKNIFTVKGDAVKPLPSNLPKEFDKIFVDPPCSALGTIRKNPEAKWLKNPSDIQRLKGLQSRILNNACKYLKTGGVLLYSVCTFTKEETFEAAEKFLLNNNNFSIDPIKQVEGIKIDQFITKEGFLFIPPFFRDLEPFFAARFYKT